MNTDTEIRKSDSSEVNDDRINLKYQDKEYNESFKKWRKQKQNSIGFYFVEKPNQLTYQDKVGFIHDYPEAIEANAFRRVMNVLGFILLYKVIFDIFSTYFLPVFLEIMGLDIHTAFFSGERHGNETLIIVIDIITQVVGRILPIAILIKHIQMPFSVMLPTKITNKPMFRFCVPATLLVTAVCSVMSFSYEEILEEVGINTSRSLMVPKEPDNLVLFLIQLILAAVVSELCTHGVFLQFTRQFGDGTALIITSIIYAVCTYDITAIPFSFIITMVIGYFTIRTGSVVTAVTMRIVQKLFIYVLYFLDYIADDSYSATLIAMIFFASIVIGLAGTIHFFCNHSDRFSITLKERYLSASAKVLCAASCIPLIVWFTLSFVVTILNLNFKV
ncbi:MAG: CPBP family intramembrane metalloprotease [Oscillospiraceae bacterium]|nr:CPBP family intramembrane metalloprotease [Oscillospiraceae bacterium]